MTVEFAFNVGYLLLSEMNCYLALPWPEMSAVSTCSLILILSSRDKAEDRRRPTLKASTIDRR